jgi:DNA topoisomerase VI subunit B
MPLIVTPEIGIPFPFDTTPEELDDFRAKAEVMLHTIEELEQNGLDLTVTDDDRQMSHGMFLEEKIPSTLATPASIKHLNAIISEYDREVMGVNRRLRNYITNKLVLESTDSDAKVRLKALEMLGKISGVGLFSERVDVNVTHRTVKDIETELRKTLELYEGEYTEVKPASRNLANIDLDAELGTKDGSGTAP